ncbi:MAG: hypothetical protein OCU18_09555, partial [Candidatus Syntrophoarchaeum sp.]|nr:hypothetical protein [Candidatus Syntrophoarchaeum sp.]
SRQIVLENDETTIVLDPGTTTNITDTMYFRIANDTSAIQFYPFVERTIGGEEPTPPPETIPDTDTELEIRGTIEELDAIKTTLGYDRTWNSSEFGAFWYDPDDNMCTENLTILADTLTYPDDRTLDENTVIYDTHPVFQRYKLYENEGLTVDGDEGYHAEGWMTEKYVAIDGEADKLCKLLEEFKDDEEKILYTGKEWNLSDGFSLVASQIDLEGDSVSFTLEKNGTVIDEGVASAGEAYTYTTNISGEEDVPVFSCYVDAVFREDDTNATRLMYVFLIDDDVLEIETSQIYGAMEVMTASSNELILTNDGATLDLDLGSTEHIMGNVYFRTADDDVNDHIRFYPFVEYTEPGTYEVRGTIEEPDADSPLLTVNTPSGTPAYEQGHMWDYSSFAGFWYDLDGDLQTETLTILAKERDAPHGDTLNYPGDREIGEGSLVYKTHPVFQEYEMHQDIADPDRDEQTPMEEAYDGDGISDRDINGGGLPDGMNGPDLLDRDIGLCIESDNPGGDCGYFLEGWMGEKYVAIDGNADKLCKLLVEFEDDDKKTLYLGDEWNISGGFTLELIGIDDTGDKATLQLSKNGVPLDTPACVTTGGTAQERVYTYNEDIGGEQDIPVFSCYVDAVFKGDISYVQLMYVFLIDDDVLEIDTSDTYGAMEVMTASSRQIVLENDETTIVLDPGTTTNITDT